MNDTLKLGDCQRGLSSLIRPHFTEGLLLQDDDLTAGVTYTRALSRMMFRTLFGCGVLCGLEVKPPKLECGKLKIDVDKGLALDCLGDPVELPKSVTIEIDVCKVAVGNELWIALKQKEKCCAPRTAVCTPDEDDPPSVCTRERDQYELCVFSNRPPCSCGCAALTPPAATGESTPITKKSGAKATAAPATPPTSTEPTKETWPLPNTPCLCNQRTATGACYDKHYLGECPCDCCECEWIVLAKASTDGNIWKVDHSVRRFVRPVLMSDPLLREVRQGA
ncbi:hypothetical protein QTI17_31375 [Variovorax sp. J31P179]|uniref:hypothetical protein n=1 Tax=Variovorax sp. J31P179 TaxID=3053508 RepID=UPI002576C779|nr:hypothetical protein [Variovorax sp. J31P179]MDM0085097.1 hypothetical protein [Variovorax sp. J31P179]